jgi:hypothetical protein
MPATDALQLILAPIVEERAREGRQVSLDGVLQVDLSEEGRPGVGERWGIRPGREMEARPERTYSSFVKGYAYLPVKITRK